MVAFIHLIIEFIKKLLGMGSDAPALSAGGSASGPVASASAGAGAEEPELDPAQEEWNDLQKLIQRVEGGGVDLAGANWQDAVDWWKREFGIEEAQQGGAEYDQIIAKYGYVDRDHHDLVRSYVCAKWSSLITNDDGELEVVMSDDFQNAAIQARMGAVQSQMNAAAAADPTLLQPVNGVSLEQYAQVCAAMAGLGAGATQQDVANKLAELGMDRATYDAAASGWQAKMAADTSFVISQKYSEAFAAAQGQAGGWSRDAGGGGGDEPVSFDKFVEIMAAQACWSEQGMDVNAQLSNVFSINAATYSMYASYWSPKMGTDVAMMRRYSELDAKYRAKYAGAGMDDDLSL